MKEDTSFRNLVELLNAKWGHTYEDPVETEETVTELTLEKLIAIQLED